MKRIFGCAAAALALAACTQSPPAEKTPQRAGEAMDPVETAGRMVALRGAALVGDQEAAREQLEAMTDDMRRSMKLPDPSRRIDPEAARSAARAVPGVRSVVWIDATNLLAIVAENEHRNDATIDAICLAMEPLGDTLAVVVNLQSGAARTGDELEILSRNCQLAPGDRAFLQADRQVDVIAPELRAQVRAQQAQAANAATQRRNADEAARVLENSTPEM